MFTSVLIANRGEIAVRVIRTCRELDVRAVAVYAEPDADALHVRLADTAIALPGTSAAETYLDADALVRAAVDADCGAVHPGYGFLAENAAFAESVRAAGLVFVGPSPAAISTMGEKVAARAAAGGADVPLVPGTAGVVTTVAEIQLFGERHGYPLLIKASYGGGGRGMRMVATREEIADAFHAAQREAESAFGRSDVYVERYLDTARHVEVQIFADRHGNVVWLGDRDCSVQRRHQKVIEESPAPGLGNDLRQRMGEAAVRLARAVDYEGAGTVEFLAEPERDSYYFLEMNTRIQVEHPVTEVVLGMDLIAEQLRVAAGEPLSVRVSGPPPRGHAIEVRLNAENTADGAFRPSPGRIAVLRIPSRAGVRWDSGYAEGDVIPPFYDSLIGKLIVWAPTRAHAIARMLHTLDDLRIEGVPTTAPAARLLLDHPDFRAGDIDTNWLENSVDLTSLTSNRAGDSDDTATPADENDTERCEVWVAGRRYRIPSFTADTGIDRREGYAAATTGGTRRSRTGGPSPRSEHRAARGSGDVSSPMQGTVIAIKVAIGDAVEAGDLLVVLEAMKMENPIRAAVTGTVRTISTEVGQVVAAGTRLIEIEPAPAASPAGGDGDA